ncbi:hypothetical protein K440DRAFT_572099, partial [Wilcoxina mikolae CBS 423.85]
PYRIRKEIHLCTYQLELPSTIHIHSIQLVSMSDTISQDSLSRQVQSPLPVPVFNKEEEYKVEQNDDSQIFPK